MLHVRHHCRLAIWVQVILLDGKVSPHGEKSRSGAIVGNGGDAISSRYALV
jgi:hypothetical protein